MGRRAEKPITAERLAHAQAPRSSHKDIVELAERTEREPLAGRDMGRLAELDYLWGLWQRLPLATTRHPDTGKEGVMADKQTIILPGATDADGNQGTLTLTVNPGGNVRAEFTAAENTDADADSEPRPDQSLPDPDSSDAT